MKSIQILSLLVFIVLFSSCKNESDGELAKYSEIGLHIASTTKAQMEKHLIKTIKEKGTSEALQFCYINAYPITDSMATVHQASIKRVTDRPRNPINKANKIELENVSYFKSILAEGGEVKPIIEEKEDKVSFYYPIVTNKKCLQCHGAPNTEIKESTLTNLLYLYPSDRATGYSENQVRGIWSIQFKKEKATTANE